MMILAKNLKPGMQLTLHYGRGHIYVVKVQRLIKKGVPRIRVTYSTGYNNDFNEDDQIEIETVKFSYVLARVENKNGEDLEVYWAKNGKGWTPHRKHAYTFDSPKTPTTPPFDRDDIYWIESERR